MRLGRVETGRRLLSQACERLEREEAALAPLAEALIYRSIARRLLGDYPQACAEGNALALLEQTGVEMPELADDSAGASLGSALSMMGMLEPGIEWLRSLAAYRQAEDTERGGGGDGYRHRLRQ